MNLAWNNKAVDQQVYDLESRLEDRRIDSCDDIQVNRSVNAGELPFETQQIPAQVDGRVKTEFRNNFV